MTRRRRGRVAAGLQVAGIPVLSVGLGVIAPWIGVAALVEFTDEQILARVPGWSEGRDAEQAGTFAV